MLHPCPCCGYCTLKDLSPGSFGLCPICCWEDTGKWPLLDSNGVDLDEAQANFLAIGACEPGWEGVSREPTDSDFRAPSWAPWAIRKDTERAAVRTQIHAAFGHLRRGAGMTIYDAELADDYGMESERSRAIRGLNYERWEGIEARLLEDFAVLSFFDPPGFRFHMPAYMVFTLDCGDTSASLSADFTLYALDPGAASDSLYQWHMERFAGFTQPERDAVVAFLRWCRDFGADLDTTYTARALGYWTSEQRQR